jgi:Holliday junction resolvase RusA-like endonuclease
MGRTRLPAHILSKIPAAEHQDTRPRAPRMLLTLPFPPTLNHMFPTIITKSGKPRRIKSKAAKDYAKAVSDRVGLWSNAHQQQPPAAPYALSLRVYPPADGRKHDLTNCFKAPEDALMQAIGGDDNDVLRLVAVKLMPDPEPRVELYLETLT